MKWNFSYFLILKFYFASALIYGQSYTSYFTGNTTNVNTVPLGGTCLMGGANEDDNAMIWFLNRANGGDVLVLRASGSNGYNNYMYNQLGVSINSVESIVFNNGNASSESYIHDKIKNAEAIWFAGGNQWNYVSYWRGTAIDSLINDAITNRNIVIGGTSAGMAIAGEHYFSAENGTINSTDAMNNPYDSRVTIGTLPFLRVRYLEDVITDTHYDDRNREGRHVTFLARTLTDFKNYSKGIAADEYTAICVDEYGIASVYGDPSKDNFAYFLKPNCNLQNYLPENCSSGTPLNWDRNGEAVIVYKIKGTSNGSNTIDLKDWTDGVGGTWEYWSVSDGTFSSQSATPDACQGDKK